MVTFRKYNLLRRFQEDTFPEQTSPERNLPGIPPVEIFIPRLRKKTFKKYWNQRRKEKKRNKFLFRIRQKTDISN